MEMNQINHVNSHIDDDDEDNKFDKIESYLIGCVSVICHSIKINNDNKVKNVNLFLIKINKYYLKIAN